MFTGIVEQIGSVLDVAEQAEGRRLVLSGQGLVDVPVGASIAVNCVCLTAVKVEDERVTVEVIPETLNRTNLGEVGTGGRVNLERPMRADGRFDGHIVQGHVDGV
ncbi:MAG: riboflavin synthase, partial [Acidimicrobiia bacterium]